MAQTPKQICGRERERERERERYPAAGYACVSVCVWAKAAVCDWRT